MKTKTILVSLLLFAALGPSKAQSLIDLKKQIAETNYQKGNFYVSAFPVFSGHFGRPANGYGFNVGHSFSFGYFVANKLSVNFSTIQAFSNNHIVFNDYNQNYSRLYASPAISVRWFVLNKRCSPFVEAGFNNMLVYSKSDMFDAFSGFHYTGSVFGGLGITIPISNFNLSLTAKYLMPVLDNTPSVREFLPNTYGLQFEPTITYFFNKKSKELKVKYEFD